VCREWEAASEPVTRMGVRLVHIRTGIVLSKKGGALAQMLLPFRLGIGGRMGSGKQWMSWIHVKDVVGAVLRALDDEGLSGPVNLTAPNPVTNAEFTSVLAKVLSRPAVVPVPSFALRLAFGEMADEALLASQQVLPQQLEKHGYGFQFPELQGALQDVLAT
jgi:uncharacterized protein (TIGR01777 family)